MRTFALILAIATLSLACGQKAETGQTATAPTQAPAAAAGAPQAMPPGHPPAGGAAPAAQPEGQKVTGAVLETLGTSGYTYLRLKTAEGEVWAAVPSAKVAKGDTVTVLVAMVSDKFESKTLKRTFDHLVMGTLDTGIAAPAAAGAAPAGNPHAGMSMPTTASIPADDTPIKVAKAEGAEGRTVAEAWAARATLKDGKVSIRGKVVKFLPSIMGKNWLHLRDGSGTQAAGDNDVTVTTDATAAVGDIVLVTGTVRVDKDFGSGYRYALLVEDATISK